MTINSRIDFRQFVVILILLVGLYWLLLPGPKKPQRKKSKYDFPKSLATDLVIENENFKVEHINKGEDANPIKTPPGREKSETLEHEIQSLKLKLQENEDVKSNLEKELNQVKKEYEQKAKLAEENIVNLQKELQKKEIHTRSTSMPDNEIDDNGAELKIKSLSEVNEKINKENAELKEKVKSFDKKSVKLLPFKGSKLVHLDLKGAPPKLGYLVTFIKFCKTLGADGFLIEYEDTFPWSGDLVKLKSKNAYSDKELKLLLSVVEEQSMVAIPLVQTFGHLEFLLKHEQFTSYRADKEITSSICPINKKSVPLLKQLITQIANAHPKSKWIHLGGDEVWNLETCKKCVESGMTKAELYLHHMKPLFEFVTTLSTKDKEARKSMIWDDMLRNWPVSQLKVIGNFTSPMVWAYVGDLSSYKKFPDGMWNNYTKAFKEIWLASSFKGALKPWSNLPPIHQHKSNHLSWLRITTMLQKNDVNVIGIALTGWSRFDHYGPLCEVLPVGVPSLALCLAILKNGGFTKELHWNVSDHLGFSKPFRIDLQNLKWYSPEKAKFPGSDLYNFAGHLEHALGWKDWTHVRYTGWTRDFNIEKNHVSFFQLNQSLMGYEESKKLLTVLKTNENLKITLEKYFDDDTVDEWIQDKIEYNLKFLSDATQRIKDIMKKANLL